MQFIIYGQNDKIAVIFCRDHYEDSLMPHLNARVTSKSFRRKRNQNQTPYPQQQQQHHVRGGSRFNGRLGEGIVIL